MACNPNNSLVKRLLRQSFLLFLFVFGATTIATAETYVCSFNDFSPQQKLTQAVMVRESDKVFKDQNPTLKKVGITSQREIESYIRKKFSEGNLKKGDSIEVSMQLSSEDGEALNTIREK